MTLRRLMVWLIVMCLAIAPILALCEGDGGDSAAPTETSEKKETKPVEKEETPSKQEEPESKKESEQETEEPKATSKPASEGEQETGTDPSEGSTSGSETPKPAGATPTPAPNTPEGNTEEKTPTQEPTATTDPAATQEPAEQDPTLKATEEPQPTPIPSGKVTIQVVSPAQEVNGVWMIQLSDPTVGPSFSWSCSTENKGYLVKVGENSIISSPSSDTTITLSPDSISMKDVNVISVGAVMEDDSVVWTKLSFSVTAGQGGMPGGFPGGGFPGGKGGMSGGVEEDPGFRVTPGVALTSAHAKGTKDLTTFGSVACELNTPITAIEQEEFGLSLTLNDGNSFIAESSDRVLRVVPEGDGDSWIFNASILKALKRGEIDQVVFVLNGNDYSLPTDFSFSGSVWGKLRSQGIVAADCVIYISNEGMYAEICGVKYLVGEAGQLSALSTEE